MDILDTFVTTLYDAKVEDPTICFIITKSNNKNIVVYSSKVVDTIFQLPNPVTACWQTWEELDKNGKPTIYKLNQIEKKMAYGINYSNLSDTSVDFTINAYKQLSITLTVENGEVVSKLTFSGMEYYLLGIHVHLDNNATSSNKINPNGISLIVKLLLSDPGAPIVELSQVFTIYIDAKTRLD